MARNKTAPPTSTTQSPANDSKAHTSDPRANSNAVRKSSTHPVRKSPTTLKKSFSDQYGNPLALATLRKSTNQKPKCEVLQASESRSDRAANALARVDPVLEPAEQAKNDAQVARILRRAIETAEIEGNIRIESLRDLKLANEAYYVVTHQREERRNGSSPLVSISLLASGEGQMKRIAGGNRRNSVIEQDAGESETLQIQGDEAICPDSA